MLCGILPFHIYILMQYNMDSYELTEKAAARIYLHSTNLLINFLDLFSSQVTLSW